MSTSANHVLALAEQLRETFASHAVDTNAVNLLVHDALMEALDISPARSARAAESFEHAPDKAA